MSDKKKHFYKILNNIVATNRIDNEEAYIINDYVSGLENQLQQKENIIKEVRDILKKYICNPSGLKNGWHIDCWNDEDISKLNEYLGILNKDR